MRARFGYERCGLQTGDTSLNTEADVVIMTTEILRNIMYRTAEVEDVKVRVCMCVCVGMSVSVRALSFTCKLCMLSTVMHAFYSHASLVPCVILYASTVELVSNSFVRGRFLWVAYFSRA
jgi:hypothetical protein